jgi:hypothetical protein
MPRTISAAIQAGIDEHIPFVSHLVELLLPTPQYWSTGGAITWNGHDWQGVGLEIDTISETSAQIKIRNDNNFGSAMALNNLIRDVEIRIYLHYNGDAVEMFRGYGADVRIAAMSVIISLVTNRQINALAPRRRIAAPTFTHLPLLGQIIKWGTESLQVEL